MEEPSKEYIDEIKSLKKENNMLYDFLFYFGMGLFLLLLFILLMQLFNK